MQKGPVKENDENGKLFPLSGLLKICWFINCQCLISDFTVNNR